MAFLVASNGPEAGVRYELNGAECTMGRHPECDIVIEAGSVSRYHAKILYDGEVHSLEDLKSRNHTFVNDRRVDVVPLKHGDRITVCEISFVFHEDDSPIEPSGESSGPSAIFMDEGDGGSSSTIMSKLGVSSSRGSVQLTASPEAKLDALLEITQSMGKALALDDVLPLVLNSLFKIFVQADRGFICLKDDQGELVPKWTETRRENTEATIRISRTIVNHVMESQEAILSADAANDVRFDMSQSIADFRIRSMMCAPLIDSEKRSIGVLQIDTLDQRKRFQQEDLEVLVAVATQAGIAIDNANMHENALRNRAVERDLELAHEVQKGFLPNHRPDLPGYKFFDYYEPANQVGGDYFDYISLPDNRTAVIVADVVGHGVAAALLMAKLSAEARYCLASEQSPAAAITRLNDRLSGLQIDRFVTMIMTVLDPQSHEVTIVNAGHMAPVLRHKDGKIQEPGAEESGLPLGISEGFGYEQTVIKLNPGELLVLYTDGINEAPGKDEELFGIDRIRKLTAKGPADPEKLGATLVEQVRNFVSTQEDDMCLVLFGRQ